MKLFKLNVFVGAALAALCASASAVPTFQVTPGALPGSGGGFETPFTADSLSGSSSELITTSNNVNFAGTGWVKFNAFNLNNIPVGDSTSEGSAARTGLGTTYALYLKFSFTDTLSGGAAYAAGSTYTVNTLNFSVYADPNRNTSFTSADAATSTNATVGGINADDILLGEGDIVAATAGFDSLGGAYLNAINNFALCTGAGTAAVGGLAVADANCADGTGRAFFSLPIPFYSLAFSEYNNTTQGISHVGNAVSINQATGKVDFNNVPEPASLALAGIALVGLGFASMRKRQG